MELGSCTSPPVPILYVGRFGDLLGRVPLFPGSLDENTTSSIPHRYALRQKQAFAFGRADRSGQGSRRGSHVYEINTWLWNFGRPQPRFGGLKNRTDPPTAPSVQIWCGPTRWGDQEGQEVCSRRVMTSIYLEYTIRMYLLSIVESFK